MYTDKTRLTNFGGDKSAYPVYLTLGNFDKDVRSKLSNRALVPIAFLPIVKWADADQGKTSIHGLLNARLFHQCMEIVLKPLEALSRDGREYGDAFGNVRMCFPRIAVYSADYPEQTLIACVGAKSSPHFEAQANQLGNSLPEPRRVTEGHLAKIKSFRRRNRDKDIWAQLKAAKKEDLNGVLYPFWENHISIDLSVWFGPDNLHGIDRFWRDHPFRWGQYLVGVREYDTRLKSLQPEVGFRHYAEGVGHLKQWTGRVDKELQRSFVAIVEGAEGVPKDAVYAFRALQDFITLAKYDTHTSETLMHLGMRLTHFHVKKEIFSKTGARRGTSGAKAHFNIPKLCALHNYFGSILRIGTAPQHSTEFGERAHRQYAKIPFSQTNHKNYNSQICRILDRKDRLHQWKTFLSWNKLPPETLAKIVDASRTYSHPIGVRRRAGGYLNINAEGEDEEDEEEEDDNDDDDDKGDGDEGEDEDEDEVEVEATEPENTSSWSLVQKPHRRKCNLENLGETYDIKRFTGQLWKYTDELVETTNSTWHEEILCGCPGEHLVPCATAHIWKSLRLSVPSIQDPHLRHLRTIQALPPDEKGLPNGRGDTVLIRESPEAQQIGLKGALFNLVTHPWRSQLH